LVIKPFLRIELERTMSDNIDQIKEILASGSENQKKKALASLVKIGTIEVVPIIKKVAIDDSNVQIRYLAKKALYLIKKGFQIREPDLQIKTQRQKSHINLESLEKYLWHSKPAYRIKAVQGAIKFGDKRALPLLIKRLEIEDDGEVKATLILALGTLGESEQAKIIVGFLKDADYRIRANTVEALEYIGDESFYPELIPCLEDEDNRVKSNAIRALRNYGTVNVLSILNTMLQSDQEVMRKSALFTLKFFPADEVESLLAKDPGTHLVQPYFTAGTRDEKKRIIKIIVASKNVSNAPLLTEFLSREEDEITRASLLMALGKVGNLESIEVLKQYLDDPVDRVRANVVEAIGMLNPDDIYDILHKHLADTNNRVRANAVVALKDCRQVNHYGILKEMIQSDQSLMKLSAVYAIMDLEREQLYVLLGMLLEKEEDQQVRQRAVESLSILSERGSKMAQNFINLRLRCSKEPPLPRKTPEPEEPPRDEAVAAEPVVETVEDAAATELAAEPVVETVEEEDSPKEASSKAAEPAPAPADQGIVKQQELPHTVDRYMHDLVYGEREEKLEALKRLSYFDDGRIPGMVEMSTFDPDEAVAETARRTAGILSGEIEIEETEGEDAAGDNPEASPEETSPLETLTGKLDEADAAERVTIVQELWKLDVPGVEEALQLVMYDLDSSVRMAALEGLRCRGIAAEIPEGLDWFESGAAFDIPEPTAEPVAALVTAAEEVPDESAVEGTLETETAKAADSAAAVYRRIAKEARASVDKPDEPEKTAAEGPAAEIKPADKALFNLYEQFEETRKDESGSEEEGAAPKRRTPAKSAAQMWFEKHFSKADRAVFYFTLIKHPDYDSFWNALCKRVFEDLEEYRIYDLLKYHETKCQAVKDEDTPKKTTPNKTASVETASAETEAGSAEAGSEEAEAAKADATLVELAKGAETAKSATASATELAASSSSAFSEYIQSLIAKHAKTEYSDDDGALQALPDCLRSILIGRNPKRSFIQNINLDVDTIIKVIECSGNMHYFEREIERKEAEMTRFSRKRDVDVETLEEEIYTHRKEIKECSQKMKDIGHEFPAKFLQVDNNSIFNTYLNKKVKSLDRKAKRAFLAELARHKDQLSDVLEMVIPPKDRSRLIIFGGVDYKSVQRDGMELAKECVFAEYLSATTKALRFGLRFVSKGWCERKFDEIVDERYKHLAVEFSRKHRKK